MLKQAEHWLKKLYLLKQQEKTNERKQLVQEHIDIMAYLINCAEKIEIERGRGNDLPDKPEVSE